MIGVDEFLGCGRYVGKDAKPAEGIHPFESLHGLCRNAAPRNAMIAIAARDVVALELVRPAVVRITHGRSRRGEVLDGDIRRLEHELAARGNPGIQEILRDLGLSIHGDRSARQSLEIDAKRPAAESEIEAVVHQALSLHPLAHLRFEEEFGGPLFQHSGTNAPFDVLPRLTLEYHAVDAVQVQ
jgi:hypothetical protein